MAAQEGDNEFLRQRFQQKLAERLTASSEDDQDAARIPDMEESKPKSPFCVQNLLWLVFSVAVFYYTDFYAVMMYDMRIKSFWYWIGLALMVIHLGTAAFLVVWLGYWKKVHSDHWEVQYPKAIPVATASFLLGVLCLSVALWPVWGFLAPIILLALFMGVVVVVAMVG